MVASIDMRGVQKENVHVSFQRTRLVVTWAIQEITDWEEEKGLWVRERHTKEYQRTFPLPEGTRVSCCPHTPFTRETC
jgi:HSP20 family molecular chaperone IbpA